MANKIPTSNKRHPLRSNQLFEEENTTQPFINNNVSTYTHEIIPLVIEQVGLNIKVYNVGLGVKNR